MPTRSCACTSRPRATGWPRARRRFVDGTHFETASPLTHRRSCEVAPAVICVPPNDLPQRAPGHGSFVVLGGGLLVRDQPRR